MDRRRVRPGTEPPGDDDRPLEERRDTCESLSLSL
jgi:hypothetical protein